MLFCLLLCWSFVLIASQDADHSTKNKIQVGAKEGLSSRVFMANFPRWKNSPRKPGIPELTYDDHVRMISKKKWSGASAKDENDTATARKPGARMYRRPEWLHPSIGYTRDPFTRSFKYLYEGRDTIDERVAKVWSKEAHDLEEKRARVRREHRAHLKRAHGHADLRFPHAIPDGPALDPNWQSSSSLQYTPASGTSTSGANVLSRVTARNVDAVLARIGIGKSRNASRSKDKNRSSHFHVSDLLVSRLDDRVDNTSSIHPSVGATNGKSNKKDLAIQETIKREKYSDSCKINELENRIKELQNIIEVERKQHAKEIEEIRQHVSK